MKNNIATITLNRLIAKVDNDFNISESDWIPRVGAWTIDALSQIKCLPMERKRRTLEVSERLATFPCELNVKEIKVFDKYGCEIPNLKNNSSCCNSDVRDNSSTSEIGVYNPSAKQGYDSTKIDKVIGPEGKNFVISGNNIELNFDTDKIEVEALEVATYHDDYFNCEVPYIYDNGLLLEALSWYILYKYLSRGSKHQVYSLTSPNPVLNPFTQWNSLKYKAANSVKAEISNTTDGWRNFFYNSTFDPRR